MISVLLVLGVAVVLGIVAHELSHALALRAFGIPHAIHWFPDRTGAGSFGTGIRGRWAAVRYHAISSTPRLWKLRIAAMMPFSLAVPFFAVAAGLVPDGFAAGNVYVSAALMALLACAIPSPNDFAIFWHPEESIALAAER